MGFRGMMDICDVLVYGTESVCVLLTALLEKWQLNSQYMLHKLYNLNQTLFDNNQLTDGFA